MKIAKFFVAITIGIFLITFINTSLTTFYRSPQINYSSCYQSNYLVYSNSCD